MDKQINQALKGIGLSEKEIFVYISLLELGEEKASKISKKSNLNRVTTYTILESLKEKGICSVTTKDKKKYFKPEKPERLVDIIEKKERKIKSILQDLLSMKSSAISKPKIEIYEGKEGLKNLFENIIEERPEEHLMITNVEIFKVLTYYFSNFIKRKTELGIKSKVLGEDTKEAKSYIKKYKSKLKNTKIKSLKNFNFRSRIDIYNDKVFITNMEEENLISTLIKDKKIADSYKEIFEQLWETK